MSSSSSPASVGLPEASLEGASVAVSPASNAVFWERWDALTAVVRDHDGQQEDAIRPLSEDAPYGEMLAAFLAQPYERLSVVECQVSCLRDAIKHNGQLFTDIYTHVCPDGNARVADAVLESHELQDAFDLPEAGWHLLLTQGTQMGRSHALLNALVRNHVALVHRLAAWPGDATAPLPVETALAIWDKEVSHAEQAKLWKDIQFWRQGRAKWISTLETALTESRWPDTVRDRLRQGCRQVRPRVVEAVFLAEARAEQLAALPPPAPRRPRSRG